MPGKPSWSSSTMDNSKSSGVELDQVPPGGAQRLGCAWSLVLRHALAIARTLLSRPGAIALALRRAWAVAARSLHGS